MGGNRSGVLELAVLGLLHETPMHGYELRKRLNALLGTFRAFGYGSLYPCLKELLAQGLIAEESPAEARPAGPSRPGGQTWHSSQARHSAQARYSGQARQRSGRRSKIVYRLTADGKERLQDLLAESGPAAWDDDGFGVHFAFFGQTRADIRLRILEGRRTRLEERLDGVRAAMSRTRERLDRYTLELHRHGLESVEREVRWLNELIASERESGAASPPHSARTAENGT
ncbi:MAG: PadR family transcriptional regulator [Streptosporangiaceae bacterium]